MGLTSSPSPSSASSLVPLLTTLSTTAQVRVTTPVPAPSLLVPLEKNGNPYSDSMFQGSLPPSFTTSLLRPKTPLEPPSSSLRASSTSHEHANDQWFSHQIDQQGAQFFA